MKIYVASSWRNTYQQSVVRILRSLGHEVYDFKNPPNGSGGFQWSAIDEHWKTWTTEEYIKALDHPVAKDGFNSDYGAMEAADCCVMVLPCGRSANTEAGWFAGSKKPVFVFQPESEEPELMYKIYTKIIPGYVDLVEIFAPKERILSTDTTSDFFGAQI